MDTQNNATLGYPDGHFLFVDTETTGKLPPGAFKDLDLVPHLVQLGAVLTGAGGAELASINLIIKPDGWTIPPDVVDIHGITHERAMDEGVPMWRAMWQFERLLADAHTVIAHNHSFDQLILKGAYHRLGLLHPLRRHNRECTMLMAQKEMGGRWPKLQAAHLHFCGYQFEGTHDAMADVRACSRIFFAMIFPKPAPLL